MSKKTDNSGLSKSNSYSQNVSKYVPKTSVSTRASAKKLKYSTRKSFNSASQKVSVSVHIKKEARQGKFSKINGK